MSGFGVEDTLLCNGGVATQTVLDWHPHSGGLTIPYQLDHVITKSLIIFSRIKARNKNSKIYKQNEVRNLSGTLPRM